jgi:hypothetical protein
MFSSVHSARSVVNIFILGISVFSVSSVVNFYGSSFLSVPSYPVPRRDCIRNVAIFI